MNTPDENESSESGLENLFPDGLEIDEAEAARSGRERGKELDISDELRLLAGQNRLSLYKTKASRQRSARQDWQAEAEFQLRSHPHPECRFTQVMLAVSLEFTPGARILSISPEEAMVHKINLTEVAKPGFEVEIPGVGIKIRLGGREKTKEQTLELKVLSSYHEDDFVNWTFIAPAVEFELHLNTPLNLSVLYPATLDALRASLRLSARVAMRGWAGDIPLIGKKTGESQTITYLDR